MLYAKITKNGNVSYAVPIEEVYSTISFEFEDVDNWAEEGDEIKVEFLSVNGEDELRELMNSEEW